MLIYSMLSFERAIDRRRGATRERTRARPPFVSCRQQLWTADDEKIADGSLGPKSASRALRCGIARARDRVVTRIVSGFALSRALPFRSPRASPRRSRLASRVSPSRGRSTNGKMAAKPLPQPRSRFHVERIREVWDKMDPEGAGALSYASLKRTLDDLEIDWVRTARPSLRAAPRVAPRRTHLSPLLPFPRPSNLPRLTPPTSPSPRSPRAVS